MKRRIKESKNVEQKLAESFEKTIKNLQKEGLFENVSSFDLNFTGRGINIKLNESGSIFSKELLNKLKEEWFEVCKDAVDHNRCYGERCYINKDDVSVYFINASLYKGNYYDIHLNLIKSAKDINYCIKNNTICKAVVFTCNTDFNYGFDGDYIETLCNDSGLKAIFDMDNNFNIEDNEDIIDEILPIEIDSQLDTESTIEVVDWNGNSIYNDGF